MTRHYKQKLATDPRWALRGLLVIYANQTADEQRSETTKQDNGVGFTGVDAPFLTGLAKLRFTKLYATLCLTTSRALGCAESGGAGGLINLPFANKAFALRFHQRQTIPDHDSATHNRK